MGSGALICFHRENLSPRQSISGQSEQRTFSTATVLSGFFSVTPTYFPPDLLARTLLGSLSQRLVRKLCPKCREEIEITPEMVAKYKKTKEELATLKRPSETGCHICSGTSYFGRTAIFELASGETLRKAVAKKADAQVLRQAATKDGMKPMRDEGMRLVLDGTTAMEEMQRVFAPKSGSESGGSSR